MLNGWFMKLKREHATQHGVVLEVESRKPIDCNANLGSEQHSNKHRIKGILHVQDDGREMIA